MSIETHTVTLPVKDYEELVNNQMPAGMQKVTGGPIYTEVVNAILRNHPDTNVKALELYFILPHK